MRSMTGCRVSDKDPLGVIDESRSAQKVVPKNHIPRLCEVAVDMALKFLHHITKAMKISNRL